MLRENGKRLGRPKSAVDRERILELKAQGQSLRQIAANSGSDTVRSVRGSSARTGCKPKRTEKRVSEVDRGFGTSQASGHMVRSTLAPFTGLMLSSVNIGR